MNREQLKAKLIELGLDESAYSLTGGLKHGRLVLNNERHGPWTVYYSDQGRKLGLQSFDSEAAACQFFLEAISRTLKAINAKKGISQGH